MIIKDKICGYVIGDINGYEPNIDAYEIKLTRDQMIYVNSLDKYVKYHKDGLIFLFAKNIVFEA